MNPKQLSDLLLAQQHTIEKIALGAPLSECLSGICVGIEQILSVEGAMSSILLLEGDHLHHGAAPSLPEAYMAAIDGVEIGSNVGSCGTAAFLGTQVIVSDIASDPLWGAYASLALGFNLHACWSKPIVSAEGAVLGTFAIYFNVIKSPDPAHLDLIDRFAHLSWLAIEKHRAVARERELVRQLRASNDKFSALFKVMPDLALIFNGELILVDVFGRQCLKNDDEHLFVRGKHISELFPIVMAQDITAKITRSLTRQKGQSLEFYLTMQSGKRFFDGRTQIVDGYMADGDNSNDGRHVLLMARDITERQEASKKIEKLAFYDPLTNLPNRRMLIDRLSMLILKTKRYQKIGSILYLDLDNFKRINDSLGHSVGDILLLEVALRIKKLVRESDTFARMGGDEFVVVLDNMDDDVDKIARASTHLCEKILATFKTPFVINDGIYRIGCSIGVYLIQGNQLTVDEVLSRADAAMYTAKKDNGNSFKFFDPELELSIHRKLMLERDIITGLESNQFFTHFQPLCDPEGHIIGAEALVRWSNPDRGSVLPDEFIPIAEQFGFIYKMQRIVLEDCCLLINRLSRFAPDFVVSINVSAIQFRSQLLKKNLMSVLQEYAVSPKQIKIEITESMLIDDINSTIEQMRALRKLGFSFAIDDFGTGYSSLNYLHQLPIDQVKIDRSFVAQMTQSGGGTAIIDAIVALAKHFSFSVVAEGIETQEQLDLLVQRDVDVVQGFFFWRPMPAEALIALFCTSLDRGRSMAVDGQS